MDLALNNLQWLIGHKTQPNQTKQNQCTSGDIRNIPNDEYENFINAHMEAATEWNVEFRGRH